MGPKIPTRSYFSVAFGSIKLPKKRRKQFFWGIFEKKTHRKKKHTDKIDLSDIRISLVTTSHTFVPRAHVIAAYPVPAGPHGYRVLGCPHQPSRRGLRFLNSTHATPIANAALRRGRRTTPRRSRPKFAHRSPKFGIRRSTLEL